MKDEEPEETEDLFDDATADTWVYLVFDIYFI